ncbi:MAG: hypothetical protein H6653_00240 [Ardenticatenaceae bacterium]|nr:hypothetical protein [Ardenticatenaceae bacterium]
MSRLLNRLRRIDPGFAVVLLLSLVAIWPLVARASLPQETDTELHVFRLMELSYLVRSGEFYPRWAPDFYHGYGYPIFNYYAPLTYYIGLIIDLMPKLGPVAGIKFVLILGFLLGALGLYGFVRDNWGRAGGYVAAAVFMYAPYIQYVDPHVRGAVPESFSFGVFPLALWCVDRFWREQTGWRWATAVFTVAAVILTHNLMALLFFGLLAAWVAWRVAELWLVEGRTAALHKARGVVGILLLGLGLAAFFWLPVILERNAVTLNTLIGDNDNYDFRTHFLSLREMFAFSSRIDWGATEPIFRFNLGVAQWLLGGMGLVLLLRRRMTQAGHLLFFALAFVALLFMQLPQSKFLWEATPILPFFQFPWRMLGGTVIMLAVLAGAGTAVWVQRTPRFANWITVAALALPLLLALPLSQPSPWPDFGEVNRLRLTLIELRGRWLGTTSTSDYVPATVDAVPRREGAVVDGFFVNQPLDRVNRPSLPQGVTVETENITPLHIRYQVNAPEKFRLRLFIFDFPGWHVTVDGEPSETELGLPEGFIVVKVPAGEHAVEVRFGSTPARTTAWVITAVSLLITLLVGWRLRNRTETASAVSWAELDKWAVGTIGVITAVTLLILQPSQLLHDASSGWTAEPAQVDTFANFGGQIALIGYDLAQETAQPGDAISLNLYWKAQQPLDINYQSFVHLLRADGSLATQSDHLNPGEYPTRRWPLDKYVRDEHILQIPPDLPPGEYRISAGLWVQAEGWRLPLIDEAGAQVDDKAVLMTLIVEE